MDVAIEPMSPSDWEQVRAVFMEGVQTGHATFETEAPEWEEWDQTHLAACRLVAHADGRVVGWVALSGVSWRPCYVGVAKLSIYVGSGLRGKGIGRALLQALIEESERCSIWTLQASTFPENEASLRLQASCGFRVLGRRERIARHHGVWRDTIITERRSEVVGVD